MAQWTSEEWAAVGVPVVERCKREIRADMAADRIPTTIATFADLHDHVDANEYGSACEVDPDTGRGWWDGDDAERDAAMAFWDRVQAEVDAWMKAGMP